MGVGEDTVRVNSASALVRIRLVFMVFMREPLHIHRAAIWDRIDAMASARTLDRYREGSSTSWHALPEFRHDPTSILERHANGCWSLELAGPVSDDSMYIQLADLQPVRGMERASYVHIVFPSDVEIAEIANLGEWTINQLPLWWGAAGYAFHHTAGRVDTAYRCISGLAKRYWATQILDFTALQWDAIRGMQSVNWLSLVGKGLIEQTGSSLDDIYVRAGALAGKGIFRRQGSFGVVLASGARPLLGDINANEDFGGYVSVARLLRPILLTEHTSLAGPFARPDVLAAWLNRFAAPSAWLACEITSD